MGLLELSVLIPSAPDGGHCPHAPKLWREFESKLRGAIPHGILLQRKRPVYGAYRTGNAWVGDESKEYRLFIPESASAPLSAVLSWAHDAFAQNDGLYVEVTPLATLCKPQDDLSVLIARALAVHSEGAAMEVLAECSFQCVINAVRKPQFDQMMRALQVVVDGFQGPEDVVLVRVASTDDFDEVPTLFGRQSSWIRVKVAIPAANVEQLRLFLRRTHSSLNLGQPIVLSVMGRVETVQSVGDETLDDYWSAEAPLRAGRRR